MRILFSVFLFAASALGQEGIPSNVGTGTLPTGLEGVTNLNVVNQRRIETLQECVEALQARYERGLDNVGLMLAAQTELASAQIDSTTVKEERLDYIENSLKFALLNWQRIKELQKVGARGGDAAAECQARAAVFKYRAMWLKEKGDSNSLEISQGMLGMYRERSGDPAFWAEPLNAVTNASFLIAALFALALAHRRQALRMSTITLISLAAVMGCGSFLFHTIPTPLTNWLDIIPITLFQVLFTWLISCKLLSNKVWISAGIVIAVVGASFVLLPFHQPINGSLFYMPSLAAMLTFGGLWASRSKSEPFLLMGTACCFAIAITARSCDWSVPWPIGTHFLWHLLNGVVVYLVLRTWIVATSLKDVTGRK